MSSAIRSLLQQGHSARGNGQRDAALRAFQDAVALAKKSGATEELVLALKGQAQIERDAGRTEAARLLYVEAVDVCRQFGDPLLIAHTVRHLADIHLDANRLTEAEVLYREALSIYRSDLKTGVLDLANTLRPLGILLERSGRAAETPAMWAEAKTLYNSLNLREAVEECAKHLRK